MSKFLRATRLIALRAVVAALKGAAFIAVLLLMISLFALKASTQHGDDQVK